LIFCSNPEPIAKIQLKAGGSHGYKLIQIENDSEIKQRLEAERARLRKITGLDQPTHFHRPVERAFTADERNQVTILFGGFTWSTRI
jgi:hypothetical protein